ncbi:50S ribosomal protein L6 [Criibacterium bergeronii]|uniref:Large ribosomal subunit protein uL6 n=1 Tax=Criibacterium bergeronii TaxID=1871336 RepID=A0A371IMQ6_9FIRM|nr:50S ribosomal protein L6 [Criibacterium bergeronii]MBS6063893.1 50S ribosomal protein L6 [Peptostreptococcaceae bacterium]RDY21767.1 50S ribosomal protein L6 [Criibacterium bergeronii]TRW26016.1 50S ribosomal protein L6 [Criibacterium bergeronii]
MSRIGNKEITVPAGVTIDVQETNLVQVKGPKGTLQEQISPEMIIEQEAGVLRVKRPSEDKKHRSLHGLSRTLINNMIVGVTEGYQKKLEIVGVGYKAAKQGKKLVLSLGYSHPVEMEDPEGIEVEVQEATKIVVKGNNKQAVGNYAAKIRDWRKPEPYKGKGIRYEGEHVRRKEGKTGKK